MPEPPKVVEKPLKAETKPQPEAAPELPPALGLKTDADPPREAKVTVQSGASLHGVAGGSDKAAKVSAEPKVRIVAAEALSKLPKPKGPCNIPFPEEAERLGQEGDVVLSLDIDENGKVTRVKLLKGVSPLLDQAAIRGIENCHFIPARSGGEKVAVLGLTYRYSFVLEF